MSSMWFLLSRKTYLGEQRVGAKSQIITKEGKAFNNKDLYKTREAPKKGKPAS